MIPSFILTPEEPISHPDELAIAWYCVRTKPQSEHVAASQVRQSLGIETFCPRIRYHKTTRRGKVLFHQAMFPCYLFVRFDLATQLRAVTYARGVTDVVRFGNQIPTVDPELIEFLRQEVGPSESKYVETEIAPGVEVEIASGPFRSMKAIVQVYMPAKDRIRVLLEVLGRPVMAEVSVSQVVAQMH